MLWTANYHPSISRTLVSIKLELRHGYFHGLFFHGSSLHGPHVQSCTTIPSISKNQFPSYQLLLATSYSNISAVIRKLNSHIITRHLNFLSYINHNIKFTLSLITSLLSFLFCESQSTIHISNRVSCQQIFSHLVKQVSRNNWFCGIDWLPAKAWVPGHFPPHLYMSGCCDVHGPMFVLRSVQGCMRKQPVSRHTAHPSLL